MWMKLCARKLRLAHFSFDHLILCSSTNEMPPSGLTNSPLGMV